MTEKPILKKEQVVFAIGEPQIPGDVPTLILGITPEAIEYMKDGHCHTFDLRKAGVPIKVMMFGAPDQDTAYEWITSGANKGGTPINDQRKKDFSIKIPKDN